MSRETQYCLYGRVEIILCVLMGIVYMRSCVCLHAATSSEHCADVAIVLNKWCVFRTPEPADGRKRLYFIYLFFFVLILVFFPHFVSPNYTTTTTCTSRPFSVDNTAGPLFIVSFGGVRLHDCYTYNRPLQTRDSGYCPGRPTLRHYIILCAFCRATCTF